MGGDTLSGAESDRAFAASVNRAGNVLLLVDATFGGEKTDAAPIPDNGLRLASDRVLQRRTLLPPYPELAAAAAGFGHNYFALDRRRSRAAYRSVRPVGRTHACPRSAWQRR